MNDVFENFNGQKVEKEIVSFLRTTTQQTKHKHVVIGLSGGIDSAVSCALVTQALSSANIIPVFLPYNLDIPNDLKDVLLILKFCNISTQRLIIIDIKPIVESFMSIVSSRNIQRIGNCIARVRMTILYDIAKQQNALVLGTENRSEYLLGYFTMHGDGASDIEPIRSLYKTEVCQLAAHLHIPAPICRKIPSAGLWKHQSDEQELGFSYKEADRILYRFFDLKESETSIKKDFSDRLVYQVLHHARSNAYKHVVPYVL